MPEPPSRTPGVRKNPRTPSGATLQTSCASYRSWWLLEPGSLPTVVGPSKNPNHPSPAQSLFHQCLDPPVVSPQTIHAPSLLELDCVASTVTDGANLSPEVLAEATPHQPPAAFQPAPKEQWLGVGLVSVRIRSRPCINGTCLKGFPVKQVQPDHVRERKKTHMRKHKHKLN